ncbi:hypothetical protein Trydic_g12414 [Trypoxylus dichotomus]
MFKFIVVLFALVANALAIPSIDRRIDYNGNWKVVGGSTATSGAYPFIVSLRSSSNSHFCGGSILSEQWILSAAHCLVSISASSITAVVGSNTLSSGGNRHTASKLVVHQNYDEQMIANDVGVVQLSNPIVYSSSVAPVPLSSERVGAVSAVLIGWGTTILGGFIPNDLQQLPTNTLTVTDCQSYWGSNVSGNQICALSRAGQGACHGDSGGPLVQASDFVQVGIVSFGFPCAQGYPDVYTRVSSYSSWIADATS